MVKEKFGGSTLHVQPFTDPTHTPHPEERCFYFYMCGPSFCSRLVVEKHFETFTTFFHQLPRRECAESETGQDGKEGVTTFFSPEVYVRSGWS